MKKQPSAKQIAARKAFGERAKARAQAAKVSTSVSKPTEKIVTDDKGEEVVPTDVQKETDIQALQRQVNQLMEMNTLMMAEKLKSQPEGLSVKGNSLVGEVEKYIIDPSNYPDPTHRLADEERLKSIAFDFNYYLDYSFTVRPYTTQTGLHMKEPEFTITLNRYALDQQGNRVKILNKSNGKMEDKVYRAKRLMFHEDPEAALVIARDNNILIEDSDEKTFLDEMRYLRCKDWLFGVFWPNPTQQNEQLREESVGGTLVQVFTKSSEDPSPIDFDQIKTKL